MFYNLINRYSDFIIDYEVSDFRKYGNARSLVAKLVFVNESILYIKDYLFADGTRKYSYHWQTRKGTLRFRWDNSPHHKHLKSFPHHCHYPDNVVHPSQEFTLVDVLEKIIQDIRNNH